MVRMVGMVGMVRMVRMVRMVEMVEMVEMVRNGQKGQNCQNYLLFHELRKIPSGKIGDFIRPSMSRDARAHVSCDEIMRRFSTQNESIK